MGKNMHNVISMAFLTALLGACSQSRQATAIDRFQACMATFDQQSKQKPVMTDKQIDGVLGTLEKMPYAQLDPKYIQYAGLTSRYTQKNKNTGKRETLHYKNRTVYVIKGNDQFKYLVGHFRVLDLLPNTKSPGYGNDPYHLAARKAACTSDAASTYQYLLIDPLILKKFRLLLSLLKAHPKTYDHRALSVYYAYRHPTMNRAIGAAGASQHLWGKAIDIDVGDINRDGVANRQDKAIILDLLEKKVIRGLGGIGRYPDSETEVHMDVRGWRARWNGFKPGHSK